MGWGELISEAGRKLVLREQAGALKAAENGRPVLRFKAHGIYPEIID